MPHDELSERLLATRSIQHTVSARDDDDPVPRVPINPDGPEAAEALTTMQAREATLIREIQRAKLLIGAKNDNLHEAHRQSNINEAWHVLDEALGTSGLVER
jgi:hypothetical protein